MEVETMKTQSRCCQLRRLARGAFGIALVAGSVLAQTPVDEDAPWPRARSTNGNKVTLHLPQVETWTSNSFRARAAVEVRPAGAKTDLVGVVWFEAHGRVDQSSRVVTLDRFDLTKGQFPEASDRGSNALAIVRETLPAEARTVSLDYLITALGFEQAAARQGPAGLKHTPPDIHWVTNHTVLVLIDGEPVRRPIPGGALERVINTPALLVFDKATTKFYLAGENRWFTASAVKGPWALAQNPPTAVAALAPPSTNNAPAHTDVAVPRVLVSTRPAELLMTVGLPDYRPVPGTALLAAVDTDNQLFFDKTTRESFLLLSGRWFKAASLHGPWVYVPPRDLPADFARIPPGSPQGVVLASVPDTPQAELAIVANSVPTTATVNRREATLQFAYDGEPRFQPIEGTAMTYAVNAPLPVIRTGDRYYALDTAVWFTAAAASGPWQVATEVPEEVYTIPPQSPVYYATFARVYQATDDEVEVGYSPGYQGAYEEDGTVVYGTGWTYPSWTGTEYYGWGWTYGYGYVYPPWYQWWIWRPWWNRQGGLRATLLDNVYDRWQERHGVSNYDHPVAAAARMRSAAGYGGYPALYGRFQGSSRPAVLPAPANTLAVNPYTRPKSTVRSGEVPQGAQLLANVRQASGGGSDLYASPDGNVYRRKNDGWYRRQADGRWDFHAPVPGTMERDRAASVRGAPPAGAGGVRTPGAGRDRVPDSGFEARAQEVAALERQYYARSLAQMRARQWRAPAKVARPVRTGGGGRR